MRKLKRTFALFLTIVMCLSLLPTTAFAAEVEESCTHSLEYVAAIDADCVSDGCAEYYICSLCGDCFADADGLVPTDPTGLVIPAYGHSPVTDPAVEATAEHPGLTEGSHCSVCNEVLVAQTAVEYTVPAGEQSVATEEDPEQPEETTTLTLSFINFKTLDEGGEAHYELDCAAGVEAELCPEIETNGTLSYQWQVYDAAQEDETLRWQDIALEDNATAHDAKLVLTPTADMLDVEDLYRCVVTATLEEQELVGYANFTLKSEEQAVTLLTGSAPVVPMASVTISAPDEQDYVMPGETLQLTAAVLPKDATDKSLTWSSSDETIATVDETGLVTGVAEGKVTITAAAKDGSGVSGTYELGGIAMATMSRVMMRGAENYSYDRSKAVAYAQEYYNKETFKECAEFVSDCLKAGNITITGYTPSGYSNYSFVEPQLQFLVNNNYGSLQQLNVNRQSGGRVYYSEQNAQTKIEPGDLIYYWLYDSDIGDVDNPCHVAIVVSDSSSSSCVKICAHNSSYSGDLAYYIRGSINSYAYMVFHFNSSSSSGGGTEPQAKQYVTSEQDLRNTLAADKTAYMNKSISLSADLSIGSSSSLILEESAVLTVPSGRSLVNEGGINLMDGGTLNVAGSLVNKSFISVGEGGTLSTTGSYSGSGSLVQYFGGTVTGISNSVINLQAEVGNGTELREALIQTGYKSINVSVVGTAILSHDLTVPAGCYVSIESNAGISVGEGLTFTNNGTVDVERGGEFINQGTIQNNGNISVSGALQNDGSYNQSDNNDRFYQDDGVVSGIPSSYIRLSVTVTKEADLLRYLNAGYKSLSINFTESCTMTTDWTFPEETVFSFSNPSKTIRLTIPTGFELDAGDSWFILGVDSPNGTAELDIKGTFQSEGDLEISLKGKMYISGTAFTKDTSMSGSIIILAGGLLRNLGTMSNYGDECDIQVRTGGRLENEGTIEGINEDQPLIDAMKTAGTVYYLRHDLTLRSSLSCAASAGLVIEDGVTLTIPEGITLTGGEPGFHWLNIDGSVIVNGKLINNGVVNVDSAEAVLQVVGNGYTCNGTYPKCGIELGDINCSISGINRNNVHLFSSVDTYEELKATLNEFNASDRTFIDGGVIVSEAVSVGETLTVPVDCTLYTSDTIEILSAGVLEVLGNLSVSGANLYIRSGGIINNSSRIFVDNASIVCEGNLINIGLVTVGSMNASGGVVSGNIDIAGGSFSNNSSGNVRLICGTMTVSTGGVLKNNNSIRVEQNGILVLASGGEFYNYGPLFVLDGGVFSALGHYYHDEYVSICLQYGGTITGVETSLISLNRSFTTEQEFLNALEEYRENNYCIVNLQHTDGSEICLTQSISINIPNLMIIVSDGSLVIPDGITLEIYGEYSGEYLFSALSSGYIWSNKPGIEVSTPGNLTVESGGTFWTNGNTYISDEALIKQGTYVNANKIDSANALIDAVNMGTSSIILSKSFSLTKNFTLPSGTSLLIIDGITMTIPSGKTFTNEGEIELWGSGTLKAASGSLFENNSNVYLNGGKIALSGNYKCNEYGCIFLSANLYNTPSSAHAGLSTSYVCYCNYAFSEAEVRNILTNSYAKCRVLLYGNFTLSADLTVPVEKQLRLYSGDMGYGYQGSSLHVPSGICLTVNGELVVDDDSQLIVDSGGSLQNNGKIFSRQDGVVNNGSVYGDGPSQYAILTGSEQEDAIYALSNCKWVYIRGNITLNENCVIPYGSQIYMQESGNLTVSEGCTLTNNGSIYIDYGELSIPAGAVYNGTGYCSLQGGRFIADGGYQSDALIDLVSYRYDSPSSAISPSLVDHVQYILLASNEEALLDAVALPYKKVCVIINGEIELGADYIISEKMHLIIDPSYSSADAASAIVVPKSLSLTNNGTIDVCQNARLVIQEGAFLYNNATLYYYPESLIIEGAIEDIGESVSYFNVYRNTSLTEIVAAVESGATVFQVMENYTINSSVTIPEDVSIFVTGCKLTLGKNCSFTNNGSLLVENAGIVNILGKYIGGKIQLSDDSSVFPISTPHCVRGCLAQVVSVSATEILATGFSESLAAQVLPEEAWDSSVTWSIVSGSEYATINSETGELTGVSAGTVTVRATANDDSGVYGEATIDIVDYSVTVTGPDSVRSGKSVTLTGGFAPSNLTKTSIVWSMDDEYKAYATLKPKGYTAVVTGKAVTEAQTVVIKATSKDGNALGAEHTITITPPVQTVTIRQDETDVTGQTLSLDMHETATLQLAASTSPEDASDAVTWSSNSSSTATVDKDTGLVTCVKPGTVTIKATAADGSGKYAWVKVQVTYIDATSKFTAASANEPVPQIGLQKGYTTTMRVFGTDKTVPMDASLFTYSIPASQSAIATVDEDGVVTAGTKPGTATVTAALTGDPLNRKVTLSVKVIALQTGSLVLTPVLNDALPRIVMLDANGHETPDERLAVRYMLVLDKSELSTGSGSYNFTISPTGSYSNDTEIVAPALSYVSSDTGIATVSVARDGTVTVAVKKTATAFGECVITGTSRDLAKISNILSIQVRDYTPRMGVSSLTLNPKLDAGVSTPLLASYGNTVQNVEIYEKDDPSTRLSASFADDTLTILPIGTPANANVKAQLRVTCADGITYSLPLSVTIKSSVPSISVKQSTKFNLFYTDSEVNLTVKAAGYTITDIALKPMYIVPPTGTDSIDGGGISLDDNETFAGTYDAEDGSFTIGFADSPAFKAGKPYSALTLQVYVEGYTEPIEKAFTLSTTTVKPTIVCSPASSTINTAMGEPQTCFVIYDKTAKGVLNLDTAVTCTDADVTVSTNLDADIVTMTWNRSTGGKATISVQNSNWSQPIKLTHSVTVQSKLPTAKLSASTVKLSNIYTDITASTLLTLNQTGIGVKNVTFASTAKDTLLPGAEKLELSYDRGVITVGIKDGETPTAEDYSFTVTPWLEGATDAEDDDVALSAVKLKVSVAATAPKMSLASSTLKLNSNYLGEVATSGVKLSLAGYEVTGVSAAKASSNKLEGEPIVIGFSDGRITAKLNEAVEKGTYSYDLTPTVKHTATKQEVNLSPITLKVTVYSSSEVSAKVSASGKLDAVNRDTSAITYTVTKLNNITGTLKSPVLLGADATKFELSPVTTDSKGRPAVTLRLKSDEEYATNVTYKLQLGFDVEGIDTHQVKSQTLSVKVTQSALKLSTDRTVATVFQANPLPQSFTLNVVSPSGAGIQNVAVNATTTLALRQAMGDAPITFIPDTGKITIAISDASRLKAGTSCYLVLNVTPEGMATNRKPTQLKLTIKIAR